MPELLQPVMVVVLVMDARAAAPAAGTGRLWVGNRQWSRMTPDF